MSAAEIAAVLGGARRDDDDARTAWALSIWRATVAAPGIVAPYLARRGIVLDAVPACLRYQPWCAHPHGPPMPAIVAPVEHVERGIIGIQRTYLALTHF